MFKIILPILLLIGAVLLGQHLLDTGPEAKKRPFVQKLPVVEVMPLKSESYTIFIEASGIVSAGTKSNLVAEVSGRIVSISENLKEGSYFDSDEVLIEIDKANYLSAIEIAKSDVEANKASLIQLEAEQKSNQRSNQLAKKNLAIGNKELSRVRTLNKRGTLSRSAVDAEEQRVNQLKQTLQNIQGSQSTFASRKNAIRAKINSSKARLDQEKLRLSRATVKAPYAGRILKKNVDFGQYVPVGSVLAETYATDFVNVELPLSLNQYELLGMPEAFRNKQIEIEDLPTVTLTNPDSSRKDSWKGVVIRTGAALDSQSRQIKVIVRVDNPYEARAGISSPLRIGQYLTAKIKGKTYKEVYVLPPVSVIYNREIRVLEDGKIDIIPVQVLWNSTTATVVKVNSNVDSNVDSNVHSNIEGKQLILTNLSQAVDGMSVITIEEQKKQALIKAKRKGMRIIKDAENKKQIEKERKKSRVIPDVISRDSIEKYTEKKSSHEIKVNN